MTQKVLITGSSGYIGSHLVQHLRDVYHDDIIIDGVDSKRPGYSTDLLNGFKCMNIISEAWGLDRDYDFIFHLAAEISVEVGSKKPFDMAWNNVMSTARVIEEVSRSTKPATIIFASSSAVYVPWTGLNPEYSSTIGISNSFGYAASKLMGENLLKSYDKQSGRQSFILRLGNVAGEVHPMTENHVPETHLIPRLLANKDPYFIVHGNGDKIFRDFVHVSEVVQCMERVMKFYIPNSDLPSVINIGSGTPHSINEVIQAVNDYGFDGDLPYGVAYAGLRSPDEPVYVGMDCTLKDTFLVADRIPLKDIIQSYLKH